MVRGIGLGLRVPLFDDLMRSALPELQWLEVSPENHMLRGGLFTAQLDAARERWPVVTHGLTLSIGGSDPLDDAYLRALGDFTRSVETPWHSDHLCFCGDAGTQLHDLLPLPFTREAVDHVATRAREVRRRLGIPFVLENISWYAEPAGREMSEAAFLRAVLEESDAGLLLDVNNVYVNARNHGFDARDFMAALPLERVVQLHVAGHLVERDGFRIDTHGEDVCDDVYSLLEWTLARTGPVPVLLERDGGFPPWETLVGEIRALDAIWKRATV